MIAIINYGLSNLLSIKRAVDLFTEDVIITDQYKDLETIDKIILPGVGSFQYGMARLTELHLDDMIVNRAKAGVPLLGICLGMQMLFDESEEGGLHKGLKLIPGRVEKIPENDIKGYKQTVPHIGWERLFKIEEFSFERNILKDVSENEEFYFVHSYEGKPQSNEYCVAYAVYGGRNICAVVQNDNVIGCQFHPEKSGKMGLKLIRDFVLEF